ncbi:MAG TPA: DUF58 domain-containing protein [Phycisphaerae bacterium]|nr:DUF58 domain-containing protein [Phycisphaerae bacterium]
MVSTSELLKKVRRIEIYTSHIVDDILSGQYHSAFKGRGMEFEEVRPYAIGDDVRTIDWNVTARHNQPFVKLFREERELTVTLLVDLSASQGFGSGEQLKHELVAEVGATLAFSAIKNNDKVALIGFTDEIEKAVPARKGTRHVLRVIRELLGCEPKGVKTSIARALEHLSRVQKRRSVVFLISDFLDSGYEKALRVARRRHDIVPIVVSDPREDELPNVGLIELRDEETGQHVLVDTSRGRNRRQYAQLVTQRNKTRDDLFRRLNMEAIYLKTGQDFIDPLKAFFHKRLMKLKR